MDLERIKQNFRIRSGRSQKLKKKKAVPSGSVKTDDVQQLGSATPGKGTPEQEQDMQHNETSQATTPTKSTSQPSEQTETNDTSLDGDTKASNGVEESPTTPRTADAEKTEEKPELERTATDTSPKQVRMDEKEPRSEPNKPNPSRRNTEPNVSTATGSSDVDDFDLQPPAPRAKAPSLEDTAELLWSSGHLDTLLHHPPQLARFSAFLQRYVPDCYPFLAQYLETQKATKAVEYANAIAEELALKSTTEHDLSLNRNRAAQLDLEFEKISKASFDALVHDALPKFISYSLVKLVSECLTNEITGRSTPIMRDLVGGLSEVFCLTDPQRHDNPIIYASEEFYRLTRYGPEDVINANCRFLQGKKTNSDSPKRLKAAVSGGEETTETLLNYRRDGKPFINMLMIAPLHDKRGKLKYHIGAQIDVTGLIEGGRALDGFQRYLNCRAEEARRSEIEAKRKPLTEAQMRKKKTLAKLRDLSESFDLEESAIVQAHSRSNSVDRDDDDNRSIGSVERGPRRIYADSDDSDAEADDDYAQDSDQASKWKLGNAGDGRLSGRLPGVYDSFMLLKPAPSLRIVFVSPKLRLFKEVLQTPFMSHVAAPTGTLTGLSESLKAGVPVSAKIHFSTEPGTNRDGKIIRNGTRHEDGQNGFAIWVSCTPMLGDDDNIGVWMCVIVEKSKIGSMARQRMARESQSRGRQSSTERKSDPTNTEQAANVNADEDEKPIKPVRVGSKTRIATGKSTAKDAERLVEQRTLREQESVYFDMEQNRGSEADESASESQTESYRQNGRPEEESVIPDENLNSVETHSLTYGPQTVTLERSFAQTERASKPYSAQIPGLHHMPSYKESDDEYGAVESPQTQQTPPRQSERVLIEEDSDFVSDGDKVIEDDDLQHYHENLDVGSPDELHMRDNDSQEEADQYRLESELPPSVPSSAYLPDEGDDPRLATEEQDNRDNDTGVEQNNYNEKNEYASADGLKKSAQDLPGAHRRARELSYSPPYNRARADSGVAEGDLDLHVENRKGTVDEPKSTSQGSACSNAPSEQNNVEENIEQTASTKEPEHEHTQEGVSSEQNQSSKYLESDAPNTNEDEHKASGGSDEYPQDRPLDKVEEKQGFQRRSKISIVQDPPSSSKTGHPEHNAKNSEPELQSATDELTTSQFPRDALLQEVEHDNQASEEKGSDVAGDGRSTHESETPTMSDMEESEELHVVHGSDGEESEKRKSEDDQDSAISMESPYQHRYTPAPASPEDAQSPPLSPARQTVGPEPDLKHDESATHYTDVENWVEDARPASSHDTATSHMRMDYLVAGSSRWSNARRPQLSFEMLEQANKAPNARLRDGNDHDTEDPCVRSPYSVD